jgi:hypothetical protein
MENFTFINTVSRKKKLMDSKEQGEWFLSFVFGEFNEGETDPTTTIRTLEPICLKSLKEDKKVIADYHNSLQLVNCVQLNIQQFLEALVNYTADFLDTHNMPEDKFDEISLNLSRLFLNILSMFRSLLDHSNFSISRKFGKNSEELKLWKTIQSEQYDSRFEYRFFYKLRNYCQHVGMPPMEISFSSSAEQDGIGFRLDLQRDKLLEEKDSWNQQLVADLQSCPEKIPVINKLHNWGESFREISKVLLNIKRSAALEAANRILSHRKRLSLPLDVGQLCAVWLPKVKEKPQNIKLNLNWLPEAKAQNILAGTPFDTKEKSD